ncbi:MAG: hypothetical protein AAB307_00030 [Deltaproteobacteria bacterium]
MKRTMMIAALFLMVFHAVTGMRNAAAGDMTGNAEGIRATLEIDASKGTIDLYLSDSNTGKQITDAKVMATVKLPGGGKIEKELMGMKMGEAFSYMNAFDMSKAGEYIFGITVESGKKAAKFKFSYNVK